MAELQTVVDGLAFPEGPRWHDGRLFFSDQHAHQVLALDGAGNVEEIVRVEQQPSGLGWTPDGQMLIVSMLDRRLLRLDPARSGAARLSVVADLSALATYHCNDMVVAGDGRAYVGNFGFDLDAGESPRPATLVMVEPDGAASIVAEEMRFPNGTVITPDGRTLIVGESVAGCLTAFTIEPDGTLSNRRLWAQLRGAVARRHLPRRRRRDLDRLPGEQSVPADRRRRRDPRGDRDRTRRVRVHARRRRPSHAVHLHVGDGSGVRHDRAPSRTHPDARGRRSRSRSPVSSRSSNARNGADASPRGTNGG